MIMIISEYIIGSSVEGNGLCLMWNTLGYRYLHGGPAKKHDKLDRIIRHEIDVWSRTLQRSTKPQEKFDGNIKLEFKFIGQRLRTEITGLIIRYSSSLHVRSKSGYQPSSPNGVITKMKPCGSEDSHVLEGKGLQYSPWQLSSSVTTASYFSNLSICI
jgi:hypothetical protein